MEVNLEASMLKIETLDLHEEKNLGSIRLRVYNAGHVLCVAMSMIEIASVKVFIKRATSTILLFWYLNARQKLSLLNCTKLSVTDQIS